MKNLIPAGILLLFLCSCSVEHTIAKYRPRGIGSYEIVSRSINYDVEIFTLTLYDKKGKVKDSVRFNFDIESGKPKRIDKNGNLRININKYPTLIIPKYYHPLSYPEI